MSLLITMDEDGYIIITLTDESDIADLIEAFDEGVTEFMFKIQTLTGKEVMLTGQTGLEG